MRIFLTIMLLLVSLQTCLGGKNAGGILPYSVRVDKNGSQELVFLLREESVYNRKKKVREKVWSDFGGMAELKDGTDEELFKKCAVREANEESYKIFNFKKDMLDAACYFDPKEDSYGNKYRMYLVEVPFKPARDIMRNKSDYLKNNPDANNETFNVMWLPARTLLERVQEAIKNKSLVLMEHKNKEYPLRGSFAQCLMKAPFCCKRVQPKEAYYEINHYDKYHGDDKFIQLMNFVTDEEERLFPLASLPKASNSSHFSQLATTKPQAMPQQKQTLQPAQPTLKVAVNPASAPTNVTPQQPLPLQFTPEQIAIKNTAHTQPTPDQVTTKDRIEPQPDNTSTEPPYLNSTTKAFIGLSVVSLISLLYLCRNKLKDYFSSESSGATEVFE